MLTLEPPRPFGGRVVQRFSLAPDAPHLTMWSWQVENG
jgi:hypothetical protein